MKKSVILLFLFSWVHAFSQVLPGGRNVTVEAQGGLKSDSAFQLPPYAPFSGKGVGTSGRMYYNATGDTLPYYIKGNLSYKVMTWADSGKDAGYLPPSQKGVANGIATLDNTGHVTSGQIPAITVNGQVYIDTSQAQMLGHSSATAGAISVRTDSSNELFVLTATPPATRANWVITTFNGVLLFNGRTGAVTPQSGDYTTTLVPEGANLYFTSSRAQTEIGNDTTGGLISTPTTVATQLNPYLKKSDTTSKVVTPTQLNDSLSGYIKGNQPIALNGAVTGSGTTSITTTLATSGVSAGTYNQVTVTNKGIVTSGANQPYITGNQAITISGDVNGSGTTSIVTTLNPTAVTPGTYGNSTRVSTITIGADGRITSAVNSTIAFPVTLAILGDSTTALRQFLVGPFTGGPTNGYMIIDSTGVVKQAEYGYVKIGQVGADTTLDNKSEVIEANGNDASFTITLPVVSKYYNSTTKRGIRYIIKRVDISGHTVTIKGHGTDTIDGVNTYNLPILGSVNVFTDGTYWYLY